MATAGAPKEQVSNQIWTIPNLISFARLLLVPTFIWAFLNHRDTLGVFLIIFIGSTDWVDGYIARRFNQVSELGKLLDPVADRIAIVAVVLVFLYKHLLPVPLAAVILARDLLVAIVFPILEKRGMERIPVNRTGKRATFAIFTGLGLLTFELVSPDGMASTVHTLALVCLVIGAVLYWAATFLYVGEIRRRLAAPAMRKR